MLILNWVGCWDTRNKPEESWVNLIIMVTVVVRPYVIWPVSAILICYLYPFRSSHAGLPANVPQSCQIFSHPGAFRLAPPSALNVILCDDQMACFLISFMSIYSVSLSLLSLFKITITEHSLPMYTLFTFPADMCIFYSFNVCLPPLRPWGQEVMFLLFIVNWQC